MSVTADSSASDFANAAAVLQQWLPPETARTFQNCFASIREKTSTSRSSAVFFTIVSQVWGRLTLETVQALLDSVFRPLAKYATCQESIAELFNAIVVLVKSGSEETKKAHRAIFATRSALDDIYLPVAQRVKAVEPCQLCLKLLYEFSSDPDCRVLFATADVRDRLLIPLAQYTTTEDSTYGLFAVIKTLFGDPERRAVFGTAAVRDRIFVARASFVTTPRCVGAFFNALLLTMSAATYPHGALFRTQAVRDMVFLPLVRRLDSAGNTVRYFLACLQITVGENAGEHTALLFGTKSVRDRLFVPLVKHVTTDELAMSFFTALGMIVCRCAPDSLWFTTNALCDRVLLPLSGYCSLPAIAPKIVSILCFMTRDPPTVVPLHTSKMRDDVLIPLTRQMVANARAHPAEIIGLWNVVVNIVTSGAPPNTHPSAVFATASVRDEIIIPLARVMNDMSGVRRLFQVIRLCHRGSAGQKAVFATPAVRDELFCRHAVSVAKSDGTVDAWNALATLMVSDVERTMFATARVRDDVLVPLFELVPIENYCSFIKAFRDVPLADVLATDSGSTEPRSFMNEVLTALADKCTEAEGAARLAMAINEL